MFCLKYGFASKRSKYPWLIAVGLRLGLELCEEHSCALVIIDVLHGLL